ncbi:MAG TPA: VWA domain-containing protein, partial [Blastocatellia bacterium]|nr:VWA domain-containing protein [Blastocatellia bacterium]
QSGRQPDKPPSQQPGKPAPPPPQDTRPRRATEPEQEPKKEDQDDAPIKLSASLVTVITSVTDALGNHVNDLTAQDFTIYEDGEPQDVAGLYRENEMPLRMVFLFDTSTSIRHRFDFEKRAAAAFFRRVMRPSDQAAIISVANESKLETQFTSDVEQLIASLDRLKPEGATALYNALVDAAKYVRPAEGRHVLIVLSDGSDTASGATLAQAMTEVQKSDAVIYSVHSTGIAPSANVQDLQGEFVLKTIAEDTGGIAFYPVVQADPKKEARDLEVIYNRIAAEVRAQYVLTYYSKNIASNGFRSIRVEVKRPGLQVRARKGYYTAKS